MRGNVTGEQYAQVDNQDPFASPVWRSPVYRTPEAIIWIVQLARLLVRLGRTCAGSGLTVRAWWF